MNKLLVITTLTLLTSTAWANNEVGDSYTGKHVKSEKAHALQMGMNETNGSQQIAQPADHSHVAGTKNQKSEDIDTMNHNR